MSKQENLAAQLGYSLDQTVPSRLIHLPELSNFEGQRRCSMKPSVFLDRMLQYAHASPCCCVVAMVYLSRLNDRLPSVCLTGYNMQRLLLTLMMLASKVSLCYMHIVIHQNMQIRYCVRMHLCTCLLWLCVCMCACLSD